jgi:hypothetical protein
VQLRRVTCHAEDGIVRRLDDRDGRQHEISTGFRDDQAADPGVARITGAGERPSRTGTTDLVIITSTPGVGGDLRLTRDPAASAKPW